MEPLPSANTILLDAKRILHEAIVNDTRFLSSQSIMDYSLLLGLDASRNELVAGLVDAIGSYNLFKTIESRSKLALNRGGDVTIVSVFSKFLPNGFRLKSPCRSRLISIVIDSKQRLGSISLCVAFPLCMT